MPTGHPRVGSRSTASPTLMAWLSEIRFKRLLSFPLVATFAEFPNTSTVLLFPLRRRRAVRSGFLTNAHANLACDLCCCWQPWPDGGRALGCLPKRNSHLFISPSESIGKQIIPCSAGDKGSNQSGSVNWRKEGGVEPAL